MGPKGLQEEAEAKLETCSEEHKDFYKSVQIVMEGAEDFMMRYHDFMMNLAEKEMDEDKKKDILTVAENCTPAGSVKPPQQGRRQM